VYNKNTPLFVTFGVEKSTPFLTKIPLFSENLKV
jgi:hypothetical protein